MTIAAPAPADSADPDAGRASPHPRRSARRWTLGVSAVATVLAVWVTNGLWRSPETRVITENDGDQAFFEWLFGYGVHVLRTGADPFFARPLNAPVGVNLAANTSITVDTLLFAPLTVLAGPAVSFVTVLTLNLVLSAVAWFLFLRRHVVRHQAAAALGGLFCGFAPGMLSHANGHLNWTSGWVAPLVLWCVLRLRERGRWLRHGVLLGVVLAVGFSVAAEALFFTALAIGVFVLTWAAGKATRAQAWATAPTMLAGLAVTAAVAGTILAYPLYMHFAGPQTFTGTGFNQRYYVEDVTAYLGFPDRSLAGLVGLGSTDLASNATEATSFFGVPLVIMVVVTLAVLWRHAAPAHRATLRALAVVAVVFTALSFGPRLRVLENFTDVPAPYALLTHLPLFDSALPARLALVVAAVIGVVLALGADRLLADPPPGQPGRAAFVAAYAAALLPLVPLPLLTGDRAPEPAFIADGTWRRYVPADGVLAVLPFATNATPDGQRWQGYTMARGGPQFHIPAGYFLGPGGPEGRGRVGAAWRHTDWLFFRAGVQGQQVALTEADRDRARADFAYWGVDAVVLADRISGSDGPVFRATLERTATDLLGPPQRVDDVLVWRIRRGVDPVTGGGTGG